MVKLLQVKRKRGRRYPQLFTDTPYRYSLRPDLNQKAKDRKARVLGERGKGNDSFFSYHGSNIIEIIDKVKYKKEEHG